MEFNLRENAKIILLAQEASKNLNSTKLKDYFSKKFNLIDLLKSEQNKLIKNKEESVVNLNKLTKHSEDVPSNIIQSLIDQHRIEIELHKKIDEMIELLTKLNN